MDSNVSKQTTVNTSQADGTRFSTIHHPLWEGGGGSCQEGGGVEAWSQQELAKCRAGRLILRGSAIENWIAVRLNID